MKIDDIQATIIEIEAIKEASRNRLEDVRKRLFRFVPEFRSYGELYRVVRNLTNSEEEFNSYMNKAREFFLKS